METQGTFGMKMSAKMQGLIDTGYAKMIKSYDFDVMDSYVEDDDDEDGALGGQQAGYIPRGLCVYDDADEGESDDFDDLDSELDCVVICKVDSKAFGDSPKEGFRESLQDLSNFEPSASAAMAKQKAKEMIGHGANFMVRQTNKLLQRFW